MTDLPTLDSPVRCSRCETVLEPDAERCPYCGAARPVCQVSAAEANQQFFEKTWVLVVLVLHVGLLGIPFYWRTRYSLAVRWLLVVTSIVYTVAAVWLIYAMGGYILRMLAQGGQP